MAPHRPSLCVLMWFFPNTADCRKHVEVGTSLVVQWLGLGAFTAKGPSSIPGQGTKIAQAVWHDQKKLKFKI